jgi:methylated-DNA-protein-cysteine methyltransferase related protein
MKADESFFEKVYEVVRKVPEGKVTTYGAIAAFLGTRMSARMVGWAMNKCHVHPYPVPAHRVVNRNGLLTGKHHFGGPDIMRQLLESEGVKIENNAISDFKKHYWDPSEELTLTDY